MNKDSYIIELSSVCVNGAESAPIAVTCGVPQGSVLGPLEFIAHTDGIAEVFQRNSVRHHVFADDKQAYCSTKTADIDIARQRLGSCIIDVCES